MASRAMPQDQPLPPSIAYPLLCQPGCTFRHHPLAIQLTAYPLSQPRLYPLQVRMASRRLCRHSRSACSCDCCSVEARWCGCRASAIPRSATRAQLPATWRRSASRTCSRPSMTGSPLCRLVSTHRHTPQLAVQGDNFCSADHGFRSSRYRHKTCVLRWLRR